MTGGSCCKCHPSSPSPEPLRCSSLQSFCSFIFSLFKKKKKEHFPFSLSYFPHSSGTVKHALPELASAESDVSLFLLTNTLFLFIFCRSQKGLCGLNLPLALHRRVSPHWAWGLAKGVLLTFNQLSLSLVFGPLSFQQPLLD